MSPIQVIENVRLLASQVSFIYPALTSVFHVANLVRGQQQISRLLHVKSIVLKDLAREYDVFYEKKEGEVRWGRGDKVSNRSIPPNQTILMVHAHSLTDCCRAGLSFVRGRVCLRKGSGTDE